MVVTDCYQKRSASIGFVHRFDPNAIKEKRSYYEV